MKMKSYLTEVTKKGNMGEPFANFGIGGNNGKFLNVGEPSSMSECGEPIGAVHRASPLDIG